MLQETVVFALSSNLDLAQEVVNYLGIPLGKISVKHFADGEIMVEPLETVRGRSVYIIQSTCAPVSERLMELLVCIDACRRASAREINIIVPYYGYARQDRKARARQPITSKLVADLLDTAGADRIVTVDLHATQIQGFFNFLSDNLLAMPMIAQYFRNKDLDLDECVVVSPDHGGTTRARALADTLGVPMAIIDKRRPQPNVAEAMNIIGDVKGKHAIIIDDIVDTAGSLTAAVNILKDFGAKDIYFACTHAVFSGPAMERIQNSDIKEMVITNSIPLTEEKKAKCDKITVLSIGYMIAKTIEAIELHNPVSEVFSLFTE